MIEYEDAVNLEQTCRAMGLAPSRNQDPIKMARRMRKMCKGKFGRMPTKQYNNRVIGTNGPLK